MSLLAIVVPLIVIGILLWLLKRYVPLDPTMYNIICGVVVIVVVLWLMQAFGILGTLSQVRVR